LDVQQLLDESESPRITVWTAKNELEFEQAEVLPDVAWRLHRAGATLSFLYVSKISRLIERCIRVVTD